MKNRSVLLTLALTLAMFAVGCSSPRYSSYGKSSKSCAKSGCGGFTRVTSR